MRRVLVGIMALATLGVIGCGTTNKGLAEYNQWRADSNAKAGNYGTAADYQRKAQENKAKAQEYDY